MQADPGLFHTILNRWRRSTEGVPGRAPITLLDEEGPRALAGPALLDLVRQRAAALKDLGVEPGHRVGLALPTSEAFIGSLFGAWWLGAAAVPLAPLSDRQDAAHEVARLARPFSSVGARAVVTTPRAARLLLAEGLPAVAPDFDAAPGATLGGVPGTGTTAAGPSGADLAVVQFSSGSTGHPKGVCLSHGNVLANIRAIGEVLRPSYGDVGVAWLPLHHDMGLIGCLLWTQYNGIPVVLMPPEVFIRMPARWLAAMSEFRATLTSAPNFAYQLCATLHDNHVRDLDLSSLRA
ncbi:MAG: AMP-binding protein, partial [Candidatus Sericytochromatia bacterium]|nr:AMP-binding protein [Candidatus Tanganyikabacteria bacterium]